MIAATKTMTLQSFFDETYVPKVLSLVTEHTRGKYRSAVRHADRFAGRNVSLADLSDKFIREFSDHLAAAGMSKYMVTTHRQHLRTIAADAQHRGHKTGWLSAVDPLGGNVGGHRRQKFKRDTRGPKARTARLLAKAAAMFANGFSLGEVAKAIDTPAETLHTWKTRYRNVWDSAYAAATDAVISGVRAEATKRAESIRRSAYLQRATAADAALAERGESIAVDDGDAGAGKTVVDLMSDLNASRAWAPNTYNQYRQLVRRVERWSGRVLYCRDFAAPWVNQFLAEADASHLASASVRGIRVHLLALWRAAHEADLCPVEPRKIRHIKLIQKPPSAWLYDEVERTLAAAAKVTGAYGVNDPGTGERIKVEKTKLLRLAIRVFWDTALRSGDAMKLKLSDVADDGLITITQGKTGRWHVCKLHASTLALARSIKRSADSRLIPWGASYEYLRMEFREHVFKPTGLVGSIKTYRKSSATDVELHHPGAGAVHLGHRLSASIAYAHYLDPRIAFKNRPMPTQLAADLSLAKGGGA